MSNNDNILARDLISINRVSKLLTGNDFTLRWDRGFGKHTVAVERLLVEVQDWIDSDKTVLSPIGLNTADVVYDYGKTTVKEVHAIMDKIHNSQNNDVYEYIDSVPFGTSPINVIGHRVYKSGSDNIWYVKVQVGQVAILNTEEEVKNFIRNELIIE